MSTYDSWEKTLDPTPRVRKIAGPFTDRIKTVAEALAYCEAQGLDPADVTLAHNYCMWSRTETPEEVAHRVALAERARGEHLARIKEMHEEYVERGLIQP